MWALLLLLAAGGKLEGPVIGIDVGESTSCAGIYRQDRAEIIAADGARCLASVGYSKAQKELSSDASSQLLRQLKQHAVSYLGAEVKHAVVAVPHGYSPAMRGAVEAAGQAADLELRLIDEHVAAAKAYGMDAEHQVVYDLGGRACQVSVLRNAPDGLQTLATAEAAVGGRAFDREVVKHLAKSFKKKTGLEVEASKLPELEAAVEKAKRRLSSAPTARVELAGAAKGQELSESLSRAVFEKLTAQLVEQSLDPVRRALQEAKLEANQVGQVILAGATAAMPQVQQALRGFFGREPLRSIPPGEVVAYGAAKEAADLGAAPPAEPLMDATPLSLGLRTAGGVLHTVLPAHTPLPAERAMSFSTHQDRQASGLLRVYQGECRMAKHNRLLGSFRIQQIPEAPRGVPEIPVVFKVDESGRITVEASGESLTLEAPSHELVEATSRHCEEMAKEDERDFARAEAQMALYLLVRRLRQAAEVALEEDASSFQAAADGALEWLRANPEAEVEEIHEKREELEGNLPDMPAEKPQGSEVDMEGHDEL